MKSIRLLLLPLALAFGCQDKVNNENQDDSANEVEDSALQEEEGADILARLEGRPTKLGIHLLGFVLGNEARKLLSSCPPVVKWLSGYGSSYIDEFRKKCPNSTIILRVYVGNDKANYKSNQDPKQVAEHFWNIMINDINRNRINKNNIDWLEGPNELDNIPDWYHNWNDAVWFAKVWDRLADLMNAAGYHPMVGSVSAANPSLAGEQKDSAGKPRANFMLPLANVMKSKDYPISWAYHSYSRFNNYDVSKEVWYTLRYRRIIEETGLQDFPLFITEAGISWQGWMKMDPKYPALSPDQYFKWLVWLDERFQEDEAVKGVTLWQIGDQGDWKYDDLTPIAGKLHQYISTHK